MKYYGVFLLVIVTITGPVQGAEPLLQPYMNRLDHPVSIEFSRDRSAPILVVGFSGNRHSKIWSINESRVHTALRPRLMDEVTSVAISPDARYWAEGGVQGRRMNLEIGLALLHETDRPTVSGKTIWRNRGHSEPGESVTALAFSNDGKGIFLGRSAGRVDFFPIDDATKNAFMTVAQHSGKIIGLDISLSGSCMIASADGSVSLLTRDGSLNPLLREPPMRAVAVSQDGKWLVTAQEDWVKVWNVQTKRIKYKFNRDAKVVAISPIDSNTVVFAGVNGKWGKIDLRTGKIIGAFAWPGHEIIDMDISPDGRLVAIASARGPVGLWTLDGVQVARIWHFEDIWVVADRDSRFDSNDLRLLDHVYWHYRSARFPVDVFLAYRYQDDLLHKIYYQKQVAPLKDISNINFSQPVVKIKEIRFDGDKSTIANVQIEVSSSTRFGFKGETLLSGARNLRLFRDNQLVGQIDGDLLGSGNSQQRTYALKVQVINRETEFMAYAFSNSGIKSETATKKCSIKIGDTRSESHAGKFYLLSMGVNHHSISSWNLDFAANDGRELQKALKDVLDGSKHKLVSVGLFSDDKDRSATKENLKSALDILAGRYEAKSSDLLRSTGLAKAEPKDTVFISFAGHGYVDEKEVFYMFPTDIGSSPFIDEHFLHYGISSSELTRWLENVDAGTFVLLIDACHSEGSINTGGFRPAPLDVKGLGQLAYDKNMLILAASQASNLALEDNRLQHGLMSYALVQEGLIQRKADHNPQDGRIDLREWLQWGKRRVPSLYEDLQNGEVFHPKTRNTIVLKRKSRGVFLIDPPFDTLVQHPVLFDFSKITQSCPYTLWKGPYAEEASCGKPMAPTITIITISNDQ